MMNHFKPIGVLAVAATVAVGIASVSAHHSTTMFDHSVTMTINGEVVELRWVNPHVSFSVNGVVKERAEDGPAVWVMEMTSPGSRARGRLAARRRQGRREGRGPVQPAARRRAQGGSAEEAHRARDRRSLHRQHSRAGAAGARMSWRSGFCLAAALAIGVLIAAPFALGQESSGPPPKDTIFARKILMGAIASNMDEIETMLAPNGKFDAATSLCPVIS